MSKQHCFQPDPFIGLLKELNNILKLKLSLEVNNINKQTIKTPNDVFNDRIIFNLSKDIDNILKKVTENPHDQEKVFLKSVEEGFQFAANLFIQNGININSIGEKENTPLHIACEGNKPEMVEFLISKGANLEARNYLGNTPLHSACASITREKNSLCRERNSLWTKKYEMVKTLLNYGANINAINLSEETPLHLAASSGEEKIIELLINKGADVSAIDFAGDTALHYACSYDQLEAAKSLLEHGAAINIQNFKGKTPIYKAMENYSNSTTVYLIKNGARLDIPSAEERGTQKSYQYIPDAPHESRSLIEQTYPMHELFQCTPGASLESRDLIEQTYPLHELLFNKISNIEPAIQSNIQSFFEKQNPEFLTLKVKEVTSIVNYPEGLRSVLNNLHLNVIFLQERGTNISFIKEIFSHLYAKESGVMNLFALTTQYLSSQDFNSQDLPDLVKKQYLDVQSQIPAIYQIDDNIDLAGAVENAPEIS